MSGWGLSALACLLLAQLAQTSTVPDVSDSFSSTGKKFIVGFTNNAQFNNRGAKVELIASTMSENNVTVKVTAPLFDVEYESVAVINKYSPHTFKLRHDLRMGSTSELAKKGILVTAEGGDITLVGANPAVHNSDLYLAIPLVYLGVNYRVLTFPKLPQLLVVGTQDNTTVAIVFRTRPSQLGSLASYYSGNTLTITVDRYETLQVQGLSNEDFTGAHIIADKPIAVNSGNRGIKTQSKGFATEMLLPADRWGTLYTTFETSPAVKSNPHFRIVASKNDTHVSLADGTTFTLQVAGDFVDKSSNGPMRVVADKPIMVAMLHTAVGKFQTMVQLIPENLYRRDYSWQTLTGSSKKVSIVINAKFVSGLLLDGVPFNNEKTQVIEGSDNVIVEKPVSPGGHTLRHIRPTVNFFIYFTGISTYAHPGGFGLGSSYRCEISGDPHMTTFNNEKFSLYLPCSYLVTRLEVANSNFASGLTYYPEIVMEVRASNSRTDLNGRYYVTTICVTVTMKNGNVVGLTNTYCIGEKFLGTTLRRWYLEADETMQYRVALTYNSETKVATLKVIDTSLNVVFRLPVRDQGNLQAVTPGLLVDVSSADLIYDPSLQFPSTMCSTVGDPNSISNVIATKSISSRYVGIYGILAKPFFPFPLGNPDPLCRDLHSAFTTCSRRSITDRLARCFHLMRAGNVKCLNRSPVSVTKLVRECLNVYCQTGTPNCTNLVDYSNACPGTKTLLSDICPR